MSFIGLSNFKYFLPKFFVKYKRAIGFGGTASAPWDLSPSFLYRDFWIMLSVEAGSAVAANQTPELNSLPFDRWTKTC